MLNDRGEPVAEPLRRGGKRCRFHVSLFNSEPCIVEKDALLLFLDFETTGLSLENDEIVEIGVVCDASDAVFATVVRPLALPTVGEPVHGIGDEELAAGPAFPVAFARLVDFIERLVRAAIIEDAEETDGEESATR